MISKTLLGTAGALTVTLLLPACGGGDAAAPVAATPPPSTTPMPQQISGETPAAILTRSKASTETDDPLIVPATAIATASLNDETSDPLPLS